MVRPRISVPWQRSVVNVTYKYDEAGAGSRGRTIYRVESLKMKGFSFATCSVTIYTVIYMYSSLLWYPFTVSAQTSLSNQDQQEVLNAHNHFRGIVNPTASNMERMVSYMDFVMK